PTAVVCRAGAGPAACEFGGTAHSTASGESLATDQPCVSSRALIRSTSGLDPWWHRPLIHAAAGACTRGQLRAMPSGRSWHSGDPDSERRRSTWNLADPGARVSRKLPGPWEDEARSDERPT